RVEKNYVFDSPNGKKTLAELFDGRSHLMIYHFMFGPDWEAGCPSCSIVGDHIGPSVTHLANRDVTLVAVSRAPLSQMEAFKNRMGWRFKWYSSFGSDFNRDYNVSFTKDEVASQKMYYNYKVQFFPREEAPGASVFHKDADGNIFHTYSTYGRGLESVMGVYNWLDLAPKGRDEQDQKPHPMAWVRHHDRYESNYFADTAESTNSAPACTMSLTVSSATPPSTSMRNDSPSDSRTSASVLILLSDPWMNVCAPKPGFTLITRTWCTMSSTSSSVCTGVAGLMTTAGWQPCDSISCSVRCR